MLLGPAEASPQRSKLVQPILQIFNNSYPGVQAKPHRHSQNFQNTLNFHISGKYDLPLKKTEFQIPNLLKNHTNCVSHRSSTKKKKKNTT